MSLSRGPRLGSPSSTGFTVWAEFSGAATIKLETKLTTATDWTLQDTQSVETSKENTVIVTATGLTPGTKYDYRLKEDDTVRVTAWTYTMPTSGRFIVYANSDGHGGTQTAYERIYTDYITNYEPSGIPAIVIQHGDLYVLSGHATLAAAYANGAGDVAETCGTDAAARHLPMLFMFDDWDWGGNNSSSTRIPGITSGDPVSDAQSLYDYLWRDQPQPATPGYSFVTEIAKIPFFMVDGRSQRIQTTVSPVDAGEARDGTELRDAAIALGTTQCDWLITQLRIYAERAAVFYFSGGTFKDNRFAYNRPGGGGPRDNIGIFYRDERNYCFRQSAPLYAAKNNLIVLSGDDHWNVCWHGHMGLPTAVETAQNPGASIGIPFREFKSQGAAAGPLGVAINGNGDYFDNQSDECFIRFDITPNATGLNCSMRVDYIKVADGAVATWDDGKATGEDGSWYFEDGRWQQFDADSTLQSQLYPPDNMPGKARFDFGFIDDILGTIQSRHRLAYDCNRRMRRKDDVDLTDRDKLKRPLPRRHAPDPLRNPGEGF